MEQAFLIRFSFSEIVAIEIAKVLFSYEKFVFSISIY